MTFKEIIERIKYRLKVPNSGLFQAIFRKILWIGVGLSVPCGTISALGENNLPLWIINACKLGVIINAICIGISYFYYRISTPYEPNIPIVEEEIKL